MASRALLRMKKQIFTSVESTTWSIRGFSSFENGHIKETNVSRFYGTHPSASDIDHKDERVPSVVAKEQFLRYSGIGRHANNGFPTLECGIGRAYVTSLLGARQASLHKRYASTSTADQFLQQHQEQAKMKEPQAQEQGKGKTSEVKPGSGLFGGSGGAASIQPNLVNSLRPLSPHLPVYKPQLTSTVSIFNRISGMYLTGAVLVFYLLCLKAGSICFSYYGFYQLLFYSSSLVPISLELSALAVAYHLYHSARHLVKR